MEKSEKATKEYEQLSKQISNLLKDFERNREWADIGNWLSRLQPVLAAKKLDNLPHKIQLSKRLAQCLNPSLPSGVHSNTLSVYNTIFNNFSCQNQLLPLFSIGLFPFFEHSSSSLKLELVKIFETHYITTSDCLQMMTSLMNALLVGLNENNEELAKRIYALCDRVSQQYGRTWIDGAVWVNILKSPKVRMAGFKYFMKSFKDRDKLKNKETQLEEKSSLKDLKESVKEEKIEGEIAQNQSNYSQNEMEASIVFNNNNVHDSFLSESNSAESNMELIAQLAKIRKVEDSEKARFPNFSTLVVGALSECLESSFSDTLIRRSALDLMIFYLKLDNKKLISKKDGIHLVSVMLQTIKIKEYSLTRRIYTYLFGQPNNEGVYHIDENARSYELELLKESIEKMLKGDIESSKKIESDGNLMIIEILLKDHEKFRDLLLPTLAFKILVFLRFSNINAKRVTEFYHNVIEPSHDIFIIALQKEIVSEKAIESVEDASNIVQTIDYFFSLRNQIEVSNKEQVPSDEVFEIIEWLLKYLEKTSCMHEKTAIEILELCNKFIRFLPLNSKHTFGEESIKLLNELISLRPTNSIYAGLLTLHPRPSKETLLPYMEEISLSIVCITNLLTLHEDELSDEEKDSIFFAIFKLLNCHLWEDQGIEFIKLYKEKYPERYNNLIDKVEPSEWLIYWKKMGGNVNGGVIRMLKNLDDDNHLNKQMSKKWLEGSKQICSKVIDPIYKLMKQTQISESREIFKMIQKVFQIQKTEFISFFFLEKERYFLPLIERVFECLENGEEEIKAQSISMLEFLMERAGLVEEKLNFIDTTLMRTVSLLDYTLGGKGNYEREIEIIEYFISMVELLSSFKGQENKIVPLQGLIDNSNLFKIMGKGMKETKVPYVRTLYIDFIQKSIQVFAELSKDQKERKFMSENITCILETLFVMLRENDVTSLEMIIKGKELSILNRRKKSDMSISIEPQNVSVTATEFNVEAKYAQIIELWNSVKFMVNISIKNGVENLPIVKLLSLILQSFPFSEIKYEQISPVIIERYYESLQEEIKNMTGLKREVLEIFETLWENYQTQIINYLIDKGDPRVLIHGSVDPIAVVKSITKSCQFSKIRQYFKTQKFVLPKGSIHYNTELLLIENQVNYFLYLYLLYCNLSLKNSRKVGEFVEAIINLLKGIKISSHIQTKLWSLELLYCLFERIPFRDLHLENSKLKLEFQEMTKELIDELIYVIAKSRSFTHRIEIKTGFLQIFSKEEGKESSLFDFVKIFPPTIHKMAEDYSEMFKSKKPEHMVPVEDYTNHFLFSKWANLPEEVYVQYISIVSIKTFNKLYIPLLMSIYEQDISKVTALTREWLLILFPLYENKSQENQLYLETVAEFLHVLLLSNLRVEIIKNMRKNIIEIYMGNDFFKCTKNTINNWKYIIDCCTENHDLLGELLSKENLFEGIFTRKAESTRVKIKNFERVCFLIFSGKVDKYENKLRVVLESLNEVMKSEDSPPALLILILFCVRILFIRLSENSLNRMFRAFWPSLITLLIQIYTKQNFSTSTNLLLAGLKVIELVHALELEEFNIHKWIFIFDFFGLRIDSQTETDQIMSSPAHSKKILTPFKFKPILTRVLPENSLKCTFIPEEWPDQSAEVTKRKLIVKETNIESDEELRNHALILLQYMMDLNQKRVNAVREEIEDLIEADFISLDDYIFQMK